MGAPQTEIIVWGGGEGIERLLDQLEERDHPTVVARDATELKRLLSSRMRGILFMAVEGVSSDPVAQIKQLTFLFRGLPIVAVAEKGSPHDARQVIAAGAADYLLLPVTDALLGSTIGRYSEHHFDPELGRGRRFITADSGMRRLLTQVRRAAASKATVLINGESGTGKELIARYIHQVSERASGPFIAVNCAALPENLLESELFGHAKGAFTGAMAERKGKFQQANGGTILLDEISEISLNLQAKLLRVLQEGEVDPVGGRAPIALDARVVASTNRDLKGWVADGRFREDLFYRVNVFPVRMPALRERPGDVPLLAEHFRRKFVSELGRDEIRFAREALVALQLYSWPGNVRELENTVQRALLVAEGDEIAAADLMIDVTLPESVPVVDDGGDRFNPPVGTTVREMEELLILRTLDEVAGNRTKAAEILGISIRTLRNKLNEYSSRAP